MNRSQLAEILEEYEEDPVQLQACTDKPSSPAALARYNISIETGAKHCSKTRCNLYTCAPRYMHWVKIQLDLVYIKLVAALNSARTMMQLSATLTSSIRYMQLVREYDALYPGRLRPTVTPSEWSVYL